MYSSQINLPSIFLIIQRIVVMLIDFHTHAFPQRIASKTIDVLKAGIKKISGYNADNYHDGSIMGLVSSMDENDVDLSVVLPIATSTKNSESINTFANDVNGIYTGKLISFASVHPLQEDALYQLEKIHDMGFAGIKLHPEFQQVYINNQKSISLLSKAEELGLYTVIHAGKDVGIPPPVHATPERIADLLEYISGKYLIAAHMGGFCMWDDVEKYLCGKSIYMDTAAISRFIKNYQYKRLIRNHGADKILFGSDNPWEKPSDTVNKLKELELTKEEMDKITHKNAIEILGI